MVANSQKKQIERRTLELLRSLLPSFPKGEIISGEEPDFTIFLDSGKKLGIELTELHRQSLPGQPAPQSQEALKHRAVMRAQEIYDSTGGPFLHVSVHFEYIEISKSDIASLAQIISDVVGTIIPPIGETRIAEPGYGNTNQFPEELHLVSAHNLPGGTRSFFQAPGSTWVPTLQDEDVIRAIASKDRKYDRYRSQVDEVWLVISCNTRFMSTWFEGIAGIQDREYETKFDRILILSHFENRVVETRNQRANTNHTA